MIPYRALILFTFVAACSEQEAEATGRTENASGPVVDYDEAAILRELEQVCPIVPSELTLSRLLTRYSPPGDDTRAAASVVCNGLTG